MNEQRLVRAYALGNFSYDLNRQVRKRSFFLRKRSFFCRRKVWMIVNGPLCTLALFKCVYYGPSHHTNVNRRQSKQIHIIAVKIQRSESSFCS